MSAFPECGRSEWLKTADLRVRFGEKQTLDISTNDLDSRTALFR